MSSRTNRFALESLEARQLMAADVSLGTSGILNINGTEAIDHILVEPVIRSVQSANGTWALSQEYHVKVAFSTGKVRHNALGQPLDMYFSRSLVLRIDIRSGGANDVINTSRTSIQNRIRSGAGNDVVTTGSGNDYVWAETGNDRVTLGAGNDYFSNTGGIDSAYGGAGADSLNGGSDSDRLHGDAGRDALRGYGGDDRLFGGADADKLYGDDGADNLHGDAGDDELYGQAGKDRMSGGTGFDLLMADRAGEDLSGGEHVQIEVPSGSPQNDHWSCGPNSASRLLRSYGIDVSYSQMRSRIREGNIISQAGLGTTPPDLEAAMDESRATRRESGADFDKVLTLLGEGKPVIALTGWNPIEVPLAGTAPGALHYICLTGFNADDETIFYTDTDGEQSSMSFGDFRDEWNWPGEGLAYDGLNALDVKKNTILW